MSDEQPDPELDAYAHAAWMCRHYDCGHGAEEPCTCQHAVYAIAANIHKVMEEIKRQREIRAAREGG